MSVACDVYGIVGFEIAKEAVSAVVEANGLGDTESIEVEETNKIGLICSPMDDRWFYGKVLSIQENIMENEFETFDIDILSASEAIPHVESSWWRLAGKDAPQCKFMVVSCFR